MQLYKNNGKLLVYQNKFCIPGTPIQSGKTLRIQFDSDVSESTINGYQISGWTQSKVSDHVYDYTFDNDISELKSFPYNGSGLFFGVIPIDKMSIVDSPVLNTSNVTNAYGAFKGITNRYYKGPIPSWNLSNVTDASMMFDSVDFRNTNDLVLDVRNVGQAWRMFAYAGDLHKVKNIDLYFENLWWADNMFEGQTAIIWTEYMEELPEGIRFGNELQYIRHMFDTCTYLKYAPMLNTENVYDMSYTFHRCEHLQYIPVWNCQNVTNFEHMLDFCYSLYNINMYNVNADLDITDTACNGNFLEKFIEYGLADRSYESKCTLKMTEAQYDSISDYHKSLMHSKNWYSGVEHNSGTFAVNGSSSVTDYSDRIEVEIFDNSTEIVLNLNNDYEFALPITEDTPDNFYANYYDEYDNLLDQEQMYADNNELYFRVANGTKKVVFGIYGSVSHSVTFVFDKAYWSTEY